MRSTTAADAVLIAPDGSTAYLARAVGTALAKLETDAVLKVPCDLDTRVELAEWCLFAGCPIVDPFAHWAVDRLLIRNG
jgi:hypothetical protein